MNLHLLSKYNINIEHTVNGGTIVRIGCATASFSNYKDMLSALEEYYEDPDSMERLYNKMDHTRPVEEAGAVGYGPEDSVPDPRQSLERDRDLSGPAEYAEELRVSRGPHVRRE